LAEPLSEARCLGSENFGRVKKLKHGNESLLMKKVVREKVFHEKRDTEIMNGHV
jgi:hypothetical protein